MRMFFACSNRIGLDSFPFILIDVSLDGPKLVSDLLTYIGAAHL